MGVLQEQAHVNLTAINVARTMERNKRNSIASFPLRPERANEDRDSAAGFGLGEMGMNGPSQVSGVMRPPRLGRVHYNVEHSQRPATGYVWDKSSIQTPKNRTPVAWSLFGVLNHSLELTCARRPYVASWAF